jgi:hypothetical protein
MLDFIWLLKYASARFKIPVLLSSACAQGTFIKHANSTCLAGTRVSILKQISE